MAKNNEEFELEQWEKWMKNWLLDPSIRLLDEREFRIELYESTNTFILEINTNQLRVDELIIIKNENNLSITIVDNKLAKTYFRTMEFPFSITNREITVHFFYEYIEIRIQKELSSRKTPKSIRLQGTFNKDE